MDPPSPIIKDLSTEQILEDMINDGADVDPAESPSTYLNPSEEGVDNSDGEADGGSDGEADGSSDEESDNSDDGEAGDRKSVV